MGNTSVNRIIWIDWAKSILIYLMIVAHTSQIGKTADILICGFHMPAFFILSGLLIHFSGNVKNTIAKSFKRLIVPALFFTGVNYVVFLIKHIVHDSCDFDSCIVKPILGLVIYDRTIAHPICGVIWFLVVLFLAKIVMELIDRFKFKNQIIILVLLLGTYILGCLEPDFGLLYYPKRLLLVLPFLYVGLFSKNILLRNDVKIIPVLIMGGAFLIIIYALLSLWNGRVGIHSFVFGHNIYCFYIIALLGSFSLSLICMYLCKRSYSVIVFISQNTITILCLHRLILSYTNFIHNGYLHALLCLILLLPICYLLNRYCPQLIGNK